MTKAEIVTKITEETGIEKSNTQRVVEAFMEIVKNSVKSGEPVHKETYVSHAPELSPESFDLGVE